MCQRPSAAIQTPPAGLVAIPAVRASQCPFEYALPIVWPLPWSWHSTVCSEFPLSRGYEWSLPCTSMSSLRTQVQEPSSARQLEDPEVLATGLQEGIGLAIDYANQRGYTTELGGAMGVASLHPNAQFKNIAKLGIHMGHCLGCVSNESCCLIHGSLRLRIVTSRSEA